MGFFSNLFRKGNPNPATSQKQESKEMQIINQVRSIPGVDTVFKHVGFIDPETTQLIPDISIIGKPNDTLEGCDVTLNLRNDEAVHVLKIGFVDSSIVVHGIVKQTNSGLTDFLYEQFDKESKVATFFRMGSGQDGILATDFIAERDSTDIRKVHCRRMGNYPINDTMDISLSSADISTLDAFYNIDDTELFRLSSTRSSWYHLKDKVLESANAHGCGNFISKARNYGDYDLDTILNFESEHLRTAQHRAEADEITPHIHSTPVAPPTDKFGYRTTKTPTEERMDAITRPKTPPPFEHGNSECNGEFEYNFD